MKKLMLILVCMAIGSSVYAGIEQIKIRKDMADLLVNVRDRANGTAGYYINVRDKVQAILVQLEADDQAKIPALKTKLDAAIAAENDLKAHIELDFPNL